MILFNVILIISLSIDRYDCLRNDLSSAFIYGQESLVRERYPKDEKKMRFYLLF
jgi:hypothetical protein